MNPILEVPFRFEKILNQEIYLKTFSNNGYHKYSMIHLIFFIIERCKRTVHLHDRNNESTLSDTIDFDNQHNVPINSEKQCLNPVFNNNHRRNEKNERYKSLKHYKGKQKPSGKNSSFYKSTSPPTSNHSIITP